MVLEKLDFYLKKKIRFLFDPVQKSQFQFMKDYNPYLCIFFKKTEWIFIRWFGLEINYWNRIQEYRYWL